MLRMDKRTAQLQSVETCALLREMADLRRQRVRLVLGSTPQDKRLALLVGHRLRRRAIELLLALGVSQAGVPA